MTNREVIIFSEDTDTTSNLVILWLKVFKVNVKRINIKNELVVFSSFFLSNNKKNEDKLILKHGKDVFTLYKGCIYSLWFRRGIIKVTDGLVKLDKINIPINDKIKSELISHLNCEFSSLKEGIYTFINENIKSVSNPLSYQINKTRTLIAAKKNGLNIPETLITNNKKELILFYEKCDKNLISKGIQEVCAINEKNEAWATYTCLIDDLFLQDLALEFEPSLFQLKIEKVVEIRTFFYKGKCHSMAIFSQGDSQTEVDFRRYNSSVPNRNIPFKLPIEIEVKLCKLMNNLNLVTGSIDLIYSKDGKYYFLEVNPVGQFGFVSEQCNYDLERIIAIDLLKNEN